jgi:hypothetical protein
MAEMDEVTTTRRTLPASLAARSTFRVPSTAGTISWLCDRERSRVSLSSRWGVNGTLRRIGTHLGVVDGVDGAGGGEVEDAGAAPRCVDERRAVEEVAAEDAEAALAGERVEVVRLRPVICTSPPARQNHTRLPRRRNFNKQSKKAATRSLRSGGGLRERRAGDGELAAALLTDRG